MTLPRPGRAFVTVVMFALIILNAQAPARSENANTLYPNQRAERTFDDASSAHRFDFLPASSGIYTLYALSQNTVSASVTDAAGTIVAAGELPMDVSLSANAQYTLTFTGTPGDTAQIEIMRASLGRSLFSPHKLPSGTQINRSVTEPYAAHWYTFTPDETGPHLIQVRSDDLSLRGVLTNETGEILYPLIIANSCAYTFASLTAGKKYCLQITAEGAQTGGYTLSLANPEEYAIAPHMLSLSLSAMSLFAGETRALSANIAPSAAFRGLIWISDDSNVAKVDEYGNVTGVSVGTCVITVRAYGGLSARAQITVSGVPLTAFAFQSDDIEIAMGEERRLLFSIEPQYADIPPRTYTVLNEEIVTIDETGLLKALATGVTQIEARTTDGAFRDTATVRVVKPKPIYRALLLGEQKYTDGRVRTGSVNTTQGMSDMLNEVSFSGSRYLTSMRIDSTAEEALRAIRDTFQNNASTDISLFYVNSHGGLSGGIPYLEFHDGSRISAAQLEAALRSVKGVVIVIIDCCNSGAFIGMASEPDTFNTGIVSAFSGAHGRNYFGSTKYKVLVSSSFDQNSYRMANGTTATESTMSTVFARALTEGAGWDLNDDKLSPMKADLDRNRKITLTEAYLYASRRTMYFLKNSTARQSVQIWPLGDQFVIFSR